MTATPDMTNYNRGEVILVRYQVSGRQDSVRPALVVSTDFYHQGRQKVVVAAITSNYPPAHPGDILIERWSEAGLLGPSLVTGVLLTVAPERLVRSLGTLSPEEMTEVERSLRLSLSL